MVEIKQGVAPNEFIDEYLKKSKPLVIRSGLHWKAFSWTPSYLKDTLPNNIIEIEANCFYSLNNEEEVRSSFYRRMPLHDAIDLITQNKKKDIRYYISQKDIRDEFPNLLNDFDRPIWNQEITEYGKGQINFWLGQAGNKTPLHFDQSQNFLVQIFGKKRIRLFPPSQTKNLYRHTPLTRGAPHLSQIPDIDSVDYTKFPQFKNAKSFELILNPGETLFIPAGWWHDVRSLDDSISINFWWKPKISECPYSHILPISAFNLFEAGDLFILYDFFPELQAFENDIQVAEYLVEKGNYWLAVLFATNHVATIMKSTAKLLNLSTTRGNDGESIENLNKEIELMNKDLPVDEKELRIILKNLNISSNENDSLLKKMDVVGMIYYIQSYSSRITNLLLS